MRSLTFWSLCALTLALSVGYSRFVLAQSNTGMGTGGGSMGTGGSMGMGGGSMGMGGGTGSMLLDGGMSMRSATRDGGTRR